MWFWILHWIGLYLDDILVVAGGGCIVCAINELAGRAWAVLTTGVWLTAYAVVVARAKRGDG